MQTDFETKEQQDPYQNDIDIIEVIKILWKSKLTIIFCSLASAAAGITYSLLLTNLYTSSALVQISKNEESNALSSLSSRYGGVASLAGVSLPSSGADKSFYIIETIKSREFIKHLIKDEDFLIMLMAATSYDDSDNTFETDPLIYDIENKTWVEGRPNYLQVHRDFGEALSIIRDKNSLFIKISITHKSPNIAQKILSTVIKELNKVAGAKDLKQSSESLAYLRDQLKSTSKNDIRQSINKLIESQLKTQMLANIREDYLIQNIDSPFIPDSRSYPKRSTLTIVITFVGILACIVFILVRHSLKSAFKKNN